MFLTLLALTAALILLEESLTRLVPRIWRAVRWGVLPLAGILIASWVPMGMITNPPVMDQITSILFGLSAAAIVALHGMFRDAHWPQETSSGTNAPVAPHQLPKQQANKQPFPDIRKILTGPRKTAPRSAPRQPRATRSSATRSSPTPIAATPTVTVPAILPIPPKNAPTTPPQATPHFTPKPGSQSGRPLRPSTPDPAQKAVRAPMRNRP